MLAKERLVEAVAQSTSYTGVLRHLGVYYRSGSLWSRLKRQILENGLDTSHFKATTKGRSSSGKLLPEEVFQYLTGNHRAPVFRLRRALLEVGVPYRCGTCGQEPEWKGRSLTLEVDHIDGNWRNCLRENLRFLCPNCHSQEETSKNRGTYRVVVCPCGIAFRARVRKGVDRRFCRRSCASKNTGSHPNKAKWPDSSTLRRLVWEASAEKLGRLLGVSGTAVRKRCKRLGIETPPRGHHFLRDVSSGEEHTSTTC